MSNTNDWVQDIIEVNRMIERRNIFNAMDRLLQDRKTWNYVDIFNIEDFKQSLIIEIEKKER